MAKEKSLLAGPPKQSRWAGFSPAGADSPEFCLLLVISFPGSVDIFFVLLRFFLAAAIVIHYLQ